MTGGMRTDQHDWAERLGQEVDDYIRQHQYARVNAITVSQGGRPVFEQYYNRFTPDTRNPIKSMWKSILSLCAGICLDRGILPGLDEPVGRYLDVFAMGIQPDHERITIRHLLTMTSGIYWNSGIHYHAPMLDQLARSRDWAALLSEIPMTSRPGTFFQYKEWDVILLSAVLGKAAGCTAYEICDRYLYRPLGIGSGAWAASPCGISYSISPHRPALERDSDLSARSLTRIGELVLNRGIHEGDRILSEEYVTRMLAPSEANAGYGFLWWLFDGYVGCRGHGGQEVNVVPDSGLVYVLQASSSRSDKHYGDIFREFFQ